MDSKAYTMMRIAGFLAGVGLTVAAFVLILNSMENQQPDRSTAPGGDPSSTEIAAVVETIAEHVDVIPAAHESDQAVTADPESANTNAEPQSGFAANTADDIPEESSQASTAMLAQADAEPQHSAEQPAPDPNDNLDDQAQAQADDSDQRGDVIIHTHLFWSPFRSEWAAQGFAKRLAASTEVPVEVVNAGSGNYRVAFDYLDESERLEHIERIETITGLKLK